MTSRCEIFLQGVSNIEVPQLSLQSGAEFLLKQLYNKKTHDSEFEHAKHLSELLGGLPLALQLMSVTIQKKRVSIEQFVPFYKSNEDRLQGSNPSVLKPYYTRGLNTAWDISFRDLRTASTDAESLFGVLCFLAPDNVSLSVFQPKAKGSLPDCLRFCENEWRLV